MRNQRGRNDAPEGEEAPGNNGYPVKLEDTFPHLLPPVPYTGRWPDAPSRWFRLPNGRCCEVPVRYIQKRSSYVTVPGGLERWRLIFNRSRRLLVCLRRAPSAPTPNQPGRR